MKVIEKELIIQENGMICASQEAETRRYNKYIGKSGRIWLVADQKNKADNVYVEGGKNSEGFAGRTINFKLVDGGEISLKGPWHSNTGSLYSDTGVDLRNEFLTYVVVALRHKYEGWYKVIMIDVLYKDESPQIGCYDRGRKIAKKIANELKMTVCCHIKTKGGSSTGPVEPD